MRISDDIKYVGIDDHDIDLFEGQFEVSRGMAYNSYVIMDEKVAVLDTVDAAWGDKWLANVHDAVNGAAKIDYLVVHHMEPDHSAVIKRFADEHLETVIVSSMPAFAMMKAYFGTDFADRRLVVKEGDKLDLGKHSLTFIGAPLVHWPEVLMSYDSADKALFSADGFGKFGANDIEDPEGWDCEARRYYFGIVGKFGQQVQNVLKKAAALDIRIICPLHGPVLSIPEEIAHVVKQYSTWSAYEPESEGVCIAYASVYGHTKEAVETLAALLKEKGCPKVAVADLTRDDIYETVEDAFRYGKLVIASPTYNGGVFPAVREFIDHLAVRNFQKRKVGFIENGTWAPMAAKGMREMMASLKDLEFCAATVTVKGAMNDASRQQLDALAAELV